MNEIDDKEKIDDTNRKKEMKTHKFLAKYLYLTRGTVLYVGLTGIQNHEKTSNKGEILVIYTYECSINFKKKKLLHRSNQRQRKKIQPTAKRKQKS